MRGRVSTLLNGWKVDEAQERKVSVVRGCISW